MTRLKYILTVMLFIAILLEFTGAIESKVVEFGEKLPQFVRENPNTGWLIEFYEPSCSLCKQIEPMYSNVAEFIYHAHDNLVVGLVDCEKFYTICDLYSVKEHPTIVFLRNDSKYLYHGDAIDSSIVEFAERLNSPKIRSLQNCNDVLELTKTKDPIILGSFDLSLSKQHISSKNKLLEAFKHSIKMSLAPNYWFYGIQKHCPQFERQNSESVRDALMIFKRGLSKPTSIFRPKEIKDNGDEQLSKITINSNKNIDEISTRLTDEIIAWVRTEAFPIYGSYSRANIGTALASGKHLVLSLLDEFKPARFMTQQSAKFKPIIEQLAKDYARFDNKLIFGWTTDLDTINEIAMRIVRPLPNVFFLKSDLTFLQLLVEQENNKISSSQNKDDESLPRELSEQSIRKFIGAAKVDILHFEGGNSYIFQMWRRLFRLYSTVQTMFKANKELMFVLTLMCVVVSSVVGYAFMHPPPGYKPLISAVSDDYRDIKPSHDDDDDYDDDEIIDDDQDEKVKVEPSSPSYMSKSNDNNRVG